LPVRGEEPAIFEPVQRRIERSLRDLHHVAGNLLQALGDGVAVDRVERHDF
jgi:hypothetical protein